MTPPVARIAVIVPLLNEAQGLPRLLQHVQLCGADELLIVDGGSTDGTRQQLEESAVRWLASEPGRAVQMNAGTKVCDSEILLFLHADTELELGHVQAVREVMRDDAIIGGRFDVRLTGAHAVLRVIGCFMNLRSRLSGISTGDQAMFVRREVFAAMGGFAEIPLMEDIEFSKRLKRQGRIACLRQRVRTSSRRWEKHGILSTVLLMWRLRLLYWLGVAPEKLAAMYRDAR